MTAVNSKLPKYFNLYSFIQHLILCLDELYLSKQGIKFHYYFDTYDVVTACIGIYRFFDPEEQKDRLDAPHTQGIIDEDFWDDEALTPLLGLNGDLGTIRLLPPHAGELRNIIKTIQDGRYTRTFHKDLNAFAKAVSHEFSLLEDETPELEGVWTDEHRIRFEVAYKLITFANGTWSDKLRQWGDTTKENKLVVTPLKEFGEAFDQNNLPSLFSTEAFREINDLFMSFRSMQYSTRQLERSSLSDTIAIFMLKALVERYRNGDSKVIPVFLDTHRTFAKVLENLSPNSNVVTTSSWLTYEIASGVRGSVLRSPHFFYYKAILDPNDLEAILPYREQLFHALKIRDQRAINEIINVIWKGRTEDVLEQRLSGFLNANFIQRVWKPFKVSFYPSYGPSTQGIVQGLIKKMENVESENINVIQHDLTKDFNQFARLFGEVSELWSGLSQDIMSAIWPLKVWPAIQAKGDLLLLLGLLPILVNDPSHGKINQQVNKSICDQLKEDLHALLGFSTLQSRSVISNIIADYMHCKYTPLGEVIEVRRFVRAALLLYSIRQYKRVCQLYESLSPESISALPILSHIVYARATLSLEAYTNTTATLSIIMTLEKQALMYLQNDLPINIDTAELCMSISYLYFKTWRQKGFQSPWEVPYDERKVNTVKVPGIRMAENGYALLIQSEKWINIALDGFRHLRETRLEQSEINSSRQESVQEVYALYLRLLLLIEGEDIPSPKEHTIQQGVNYLLQFHGNRQLWHYRFDNLMGRYYHRLSRQSDDVSERLRLLGESIEYFEQALSMANHALIEKNYRLARTEFDQVKLGLT